MIVISTNNGQKFLTNLLSDLVKHQCKLPIAIIDTQSTDEKSLEFLEALKHPTFNKLLNLSVHTTPGKNYDTGAYVYAINNLKAERYYFLHDSIRIKTPIMFSEIDKKLTPGTVVALTIFPGNCYDNNEQKELCFKNWNTTLFKTGIFGPMFSILRSDLEKNWNKLPKILPINKNQQMGMERGWSVFCTKSKLDVVPLEENPKHDKVFNDGFVHFTKILPKRNIND